LNKILLVDCDELHFGKSRFPNYVLMKLSAYYKSHNDMVVKYSTEYSEQILQETFDKVYSSKVFTFVKEPEFLSNMPNVVRGGTGYIDKIKEVLPRCIDNIFPDYSIYPDFPQDTSIGFITRGCIRKCSWCVVPKKEGNITPYRSYEELLRYSPDIKQKLVLMDNNILASEYGIEQLKLIADNSNISLDCNQGMDARLVTPEIAEILAKIKWYPEIRFSCDSSYQIEPIINVIKSLIKYKPKIKLFVYFLIGDGIIRISDAISRLEALRLYHRNLHLYPQKEKALDKETTEHSALLKEFADRYIYKGLWKKLNWEEYQKLTGNWFNMETGIMLNNNHNQRLPTAEEVNLYKGEYNNEN